MRRRLNKINFQSVDAGGAEANVQLVIDGQQTSPVRIEKDDLAAMVRLLIQVGITMERAGAVPADLNHGRQDFDVLESTQTILLSLEGGQVGFLHRMGVVDLPVSMIATDLRPLIASLEAASAGGLSQGPNQVQ